MAGTGLDHRHPRPLVVSDHLFLPIGEALRPWRAVVCSPSMPTPDEAAALSKVVWAIGHASEATALIQEIAYEMAYEDALYEHALLSQDERRAIFDATVYLGIALANQLVQLKAYLDGEFPYEVEGMLPDDTLVLRRLQGFSASGEPLGRA